ncbi:MAG: patatin-like phospholipase family protein [Halanaerobium sp.]|nr:patatin-like phospholipase family protein [Halanaerobium sp.]
MRKKVGLALGAGAVRGLAHLGVIEVLEREGIPIDFIAGTSIGAMVGGLYCTGLETNRLIQLATNLNWEHLTDLAIPKKGLVRGKKILELLQLLTRGKEISQLDIPFAAVACDIQQGEKVIIKEGSLADAIRASISVPGIYIPYQYQGRLLVDGAVLDRVPVDVVRDAGMDLVIAVEVGFMGANSRVDNIFEIILQSIDIMQRKIMRETLTKADLLLTPPLGHIASTNLQRADECIEEGRKAAEAKLEEIFTLLEG